MTLYYMGLRRGELLAIKWDDVDLSNKTITINKTFSTKTNTITTPKTKNSYRTITMPDILVKEMAAWKTRIEAFEVIALMDMYSEMIDQLRLRRCAVNFMST